MTEHLGQTSFFRHLESMGEDVWQQDLQTKQVHMSARFWESLGYDPALLPLTREAARALIHPVDLEVAVEEVALHFLTSTPFEIEVRFRALTGEWRYLRLRGCVVEKDSAGSPLFLSGLIVDLTKDVLTAQSDRRGLAKIGTLSERERQVLVCLVAGAANKNIAYALGLSRRTVEGYHARVLDKLNASGTAELVRMALAAGLDPGDASDCGMTAKAN